MLDHQYRGGSRAFERYAPISSVPRIAPKGLVLGAGTVLLPADAPRRLRSPKGCEALYAFVDETGNTGHNLFDKAQPDFFTAAL